MSAAVIWLVDMGYVIKASKDSFKLDYAKAQGVLRHKLGPVRTTLFNSYNAELGVEDAMEAFYSMMERDHQMRVSLQPLGLDKDGNAVQRRVDVDLAANMVWYACQPEVTTIVLTSGDQDFIPAVELVIEEFDLQVILWSYDVFVSRDLSEAVDEHWLFEDTADRVRR